MFKPHKSRTSFCYLSELFLINDFTHEHNIHIPLLVCKAFTFRLMTKIEQEFLTVISNEFRYLGPATLRYEALALVLAKYSWNLATDL